MSFAVEKEAWKLIESGRFKLTPTDKLVLMKVAFWTNGEMECWHGTEAIAIGCDASRSQVIAALKKLAKLGILSKRPRAREKGRGRASDVIVFDPAATSEKLTLDLADQSRISDAAESDSKVDQSPIRGGATNNSSEKASERETESAADRRDRRRKLPVVDGHQVEEVEFSLAVAAIDAFNTRNGSKLGLLGTTGKPTDALKRIVCRIREHPELTDSELVAIVNRNFDAPWWGEEKLGSVGPIFGPNSWGRAMACDGIPKNKSGRTVRLGIDRVPNLHDEEEEPW